MPQYGKDNSHKELAKYRKAPHEPSRTLPFVSHQDAARRPATRGCARGVQSMPTSMVQTTEKHCANLWRGFHLKIKPRFCEMPSDSDAAPIIKHTRAVYFTVIPASEVQPAWTLLSHILRGTKRQRTRLSRDTQQEDAVRPPRANEVWFRCSRAWCSAQRTSLPRKLFDWAGGRLIPTCLLCP